MKKRKRKRKNITRKKYNEKTKHNKKKKNNKNVKRINVFLIVKKLFNYKNYKTINFKKHVNDVKKSYINILNISNFKNK